MHEYSISILQAKFDELVSEVTGELVDANLQDLKGAIEVLQDDPEALNE